MNTTARTRKSARILAGSLAAIFAASSASAAIVYWDNTSGDGYGVASGTWSGSTANWNTDSTGDATAAGATTTTSDTINFGSTTDGLGAGTITVGTASSGNINFAADSGAIVLSGGTITLASTVSITTDNASNTIGSILAGASTSLTKLGTGTLNLSGANTYTRSTIVTVGTLKGTQTTGTPFGTGAMTVGAAILSLAPTGSGSNVSLTGPTTNGTVFTYNAGAMLSLNRGSQSSLTYTVGNGGSDDIARGANGTLIISVSDITKLGVATASNSERFIVDGASPPVTNTLASGMVGQDRSNSNAGDFLTYNSTHGYTRATYTLTNSFTGSTNASRVSIATGMSTPTTTTLAYALKVGAVTLTNTGTITLGGSATGVAGLILNGATISGGTLTTPTGVATELIVYVSSAGGTISSNINTATSQAGMSVIGPGALTFSSSNSFTGGLRINNSTVIASNNNQLGGSTGAITLTGGTLQLSGTVALGGAGQRAITLSAGQDKSGGTFNISSGTTTFENASSGTKILSGTGALIKMGTGTMVLSGNTTNTYTGGTFVNEGTLQFGASTMLADTGAVTVDGGTLDLQTFSDTVGTVTLEGGGSITGSGAATLTSTGTFDVMSGLISAILAGNNIPLYKSTPDTVTLSGINTYTGATTVSAGTLLVSGSISGSAVTVLSGGTLGTSSGLTGGTTGSVSVQSGGTLAPGTSSGLMTVSGNLAIASGGFFSAEINGTTAGTDYDRVTVNGTVNITNSTLTLGGSYLTTPSVTNDLFFILLNDNSDAVTGTFSGLSEGSHVYAPNGQDFIISYRADIAATNAANFGSAQGNDIALMAVPEPGVTATLLGGLAMLLGKRRRRH